MFDWLWLWLCFREKKGTFLSGEKIPCCVFVMHHITNTKNSNMCRQKKKKQQKTEMLYFTMNAEGASMRHLTSNLGKMFFEKNPTDFKRPYIMYDFNTYVTNTAIGPFRRNSVMISCDRNWKVNGIEQREGGEKMVLLGSLKKWDYRESEAAPLEGKNDCSQQRWCRQLISSWCLKF